MAISLSSSLLAAQNNTVRRPIIELMSTQTAAAIPFIGSLFNYDTTDESACAFLAHSTGILIALWYRDNTIVMSYSDTDHINWTEKTPIAVGSSDRILSLDITELSSGHIGIVWVERDYFLLTGNVKYAVIDTTGSIISSASILQSYDSDYDYTGISVDALNNGTYYLTYTKRYQTDYGLYRRVSNNFSSWGSETEISTGFTDTYRHYETNVFQASEDNDIFLFVSVATEVRASVSEKVSLYYLLSTDYGSTWSAPVLVSGSGIFGQGYFQPAAEENSVNSILLSYTYKTTALGMDINTDLWLQECGDNAIGARIHFDPIRRYLYSINIYQYIGAKILCSVVVIDVDNWVVHRSYTTYTTPAYNGLFKTNSCWVKTLKNEGKYIAVSTDFHVIVIDDEAETIAHYVFKDDEGLIRNLTGLDFRGYDSFGFETSGIAVIESENRIYVALSDSYVFHPRILIGYIDLTEAPSGGFYTWNEIAWVEDWNAEAVYSLTSNGSLLVIPGEDLLIISSLSDTVTWKGRTDTYRISTGVLIEAYSYDTDIGYPYQGINELAYYNGFIYGSLIYNADHGQENYRGMVRIDTLTNAISYLQPDYATKDNYLLGEKIVTGEGLIIMAARTEGNVTYDIPTGIWTLYSPATTPDIFFGNPNAYELSVAYDAQNDIIYSGCPGYPAQAAFAGIRAFGVSGELSQIKYRYLEKSGSWSVSSANALVAGNKEQFSYPAFTNDDILWTIWQRTNQDTLEKSIYRDNTETELDLTPYLTEDTITVNRSIRSPGRLSFTVSRGYLFDQNNAGSSLTPYLKKGRAITLRFGERIGGVNYWSTQGTFYVDTFKMSYQRGKYPSAKITCIDRMDLLKFAHTVASAHFEAQYPESVITALLFEHTNLEYSDIAIDNFLTRHAIYYQIVDEKVLEALKEVLNHFGYYLTVNENNQIIARQIRTAGDPDNTYSDSTKIIEFTPDDNFSDYTNRVTVTGEGLNPIEVLYDEELLAQYSGTGGWWETGSEERNIYYSTDKKKKARNPRLNVVKSIKDFEILWLESRGQEYLAGEDPNGFYCTIIIEFPGLMEVLIGLIAAVVALGAAAIWCDFGQYCGGMILAFSLLISAVSYLLGQVATYEYEIFARPFGEVKQQYQSSANDEDLQTYLDGLIIEQVIDDPFCYTEAECSRVANYELSVVQSQRKRLSFSKIAHIQDEPGDILQVIHPYSGTSLKVFVTDISRSFKRGTVRKKEGFFIDKIEGWRI